MLEELGWSLILGIFLVFAAAGAISGWFRTREKLRQKPVIYLAAVLGLFLIVLVIAGLSLSDALTLTAVNGVAAAIAIAVDTSVRRFKNKKSHAPQH